MKKFLYTVLSTIFIYSFLSVTNTQTKQAYADTTYSSTLLLSDIYNNELKDVTADASGNKYLSENTSYNVGDGKYASFSISKGGSTEIPKIRFKSDNSSYYLYLKYSSEKKAGYVGAYIQFDAKPGYLIKTVSFANVNGITGYSIGSYVSKTDTYNELKNTQCNYSTNSSTFTNAVSSVRVYNKQVADDSQANYFAPRQSFTLTLVPDLSSTYQITYNTDGGSSIAKDVYSDAENTVEPKAPVKEHPNNTKEYVFDGWYTDSQCSDGNEFEFGNKLTQDIELFAKWLETDITTRDIVTNLYAETLKYELNSSKLYSFRNSSINIDLYKNSTIDKNFNITATADTSGSDNYIRQYGSNGESSYLYLRSGHSTHFTGGNISIKPISNQSYFYLSSLEFIADKNHTSSSGCISYRYSTDGTNFVEVANGLSFTDDSFKVSSLPLKVRYFDFVVDKYDGTSATVNIQEVKVSYIKDETHYLSFNTNGGNSIDSILLDKDDVTVQPDNPTKPNNGNIQYSFAGWFSDQQCSDGNEFVFGSTISQDTEIYAKWDESQVTGYKLTFHTNSLHSVNSQTVAIGEKFVAPIVGDIGDEKYDYTIEGWYTDSTYQTLFDFNQVYSDNADAYAKYSYVQNSLDGATIISMKSRVKTYAAEWSVDNYEEHIVKSSDVKSDMVDSTFSFTSAYSNGYGIKRTGIDKYDVKMKRCTVTWELKDYTKYISSVRWDLKNTGYKYSDTYIVDLYDNKTCTGSPIDSDYLCLVSGEKDRCVQMLNNTDETINAVSFRQRNVSFDYGFENIQYILGEASANQQIKNFAKNFIEEITCSGEGSITATNDKWSTIAGRVDKMSADAKDLLKSYSGSDTDVLNAINRYDYILRKYGTDTYTNFLDRSVKASNNRIATMFSNTTEEFSSIIFISVFSIIGLSTVGCFYIYRKRKTI